MGVRRSHGVGGALLVVAASSGVPGPAWAQQSDYTWCVQTGVGGGARCGAPEYECDNAAPFASLTEALAAAEAAEGPLPGQRPEHLICVDGVVSEDLPTFDLAMLGPRVEVEFDPAAPSNLCPGTGPAAGPLMLVDGFTDLTAGPPTLVLAWLSYSGVECDSAARPLLQSTDARVELWHTRARGASTGTTPLISATGGQAENELAIFSSLLDGNSGSLLSTQTGLFVTDSELSGNIADGTPLVRVEGSSSLLYSTSSAVFGNVHRGSDDSGLIEVNGADWGLAWGLLAGNTALGGAHILRWEVDSRAWASTGRLLDMVVARNVLRA